MRLLEHEALPSSRTVAPRLCPRASGQSNPCDIQDHDTIRIHAREEATWGSWLLGTRRYCPTEPAHITRLPMSSSNNDIIEGSQPIRPPIDLSRSNQNIMYDYVLQNQEYIATIQTYIAPPLATHPHPSIKTTQDFVSLHAQYV